MTPSFINRFSAKVMPSPWRSFAKNVRARQDKLLARLDEFPQSVIVTGCQRSGTTAVARLIRQADGMADFQTGVDDELDGALILAGHVACKPLGRFCFQTTYLNERYEEYLEHPNHYIIWVLRNPHSVIHSMLNNWRNFALNELFLSCGYAQMDHRDRIRFQRFGLRGVPRLHRAIYAYLGKVKQLFWLMNAYSRDRLAIVEYDLMVREKSTLLPILFNFAGVPFQEHYGDFLKAGSLDKKKDLNKEAWQLIDDRCAPLYQKAAAEVTIR